MEPMTLQQIWIAFQKTEIPPRIPPPLDPSESLQFDNPFLINYVVYHHYRSLGWVVKGGIKFCVDYLLYKRGPVFTHAEYVCCSYTVIFLTPRSQACSCSLTCLRRPRRPGIVHYRFTKFISFCMVMVEYYQPRKLAGPKSLFLPFVFLVDYLTLVQTLILVYVTVPAKSRLPQKALLTPACLAHYSVREVILRRFIPARMRD